MRAEGPVGRQTSGAGSRWAALMLWGVVAGALVATLAVRKPRPGPQGWTRPAPLAAPWAERVPQGWPPGDGVRGLVTETWSEPGRVWATADALWVPTGLGVRAVPRAGQRDREIVTPGWAADVLVLEDGRALVADGQAGVAVVEVGGERSALPVGEARLLERAGGTVLVGLRDGALVALDVTAAPTERDRLLLDGRLYDLATTTDGTRWAAALGPAGLAMGTVSKDGALRVTEQIPTLRWPVAVAFTEDALVWCGSHGEVSTIPPGPPHAALPSRVTGLVVDRAGVPWFGTAGSGVFRGLPPAESADPIRRRETHRVNALAPAPGGGVWVSWWDGLVEHVDAEGAVLEELIAGAESRLVGAGIGWRAETGPGWHRVWLEGAERPVQIEGEFGGAVRRAAGLLLAGGAGGLLVLSHEGLAPLRADTAAGVAVGPAGDLWVGNPRDGLRRCAPAGSPCSTPWTTRSSRKGVSPVGAGDAWVLGADGWNGSWVAVRVGDDVVRTGWLSGRASDVDFIGDVALIGLAGLGVAAVDLGSEDDHAQLIALPSDPSGRGREIRLCTNGSVALATLGEAGVAQLRIEAGRPTLVRVIDTPGVAEDCNPGADGTWLVADTTALIELTLP